MENSQQNTTVSSMNDKEKMVVGIDVGTTKIAVFIGKKDENGNVKIIGMGRTDSVGVEHGEVKNIVETATSIKIAVEIAEKKCNVKVSEAYVGIAGHNIKNTFQRGSKIINEENHIITQEDVDALLEEQKVKILPPGESIIDIVPQDYIVDGDTGIDNPVGRIGKVIECNYNLISGDQNNVHNIYMSVERAGYKVKGLILEPIASAEAVVNDEEKSAGICLVDIGGGTTDMSIFKDGILRHTAVIQLAGNSITTDIKDAFKIMPPQSEALKTKYGDCLQIESQKNAIVQVPGLKGRPSREITLFALSGVIKARVQMILQQVDYELKNNSLKEQTFDKILIAGIVLTGGGSKLKHIAQYTEFITGISTRVGDPDEIFLSDNSDECSDPMYSTGIGLVIKGFEFEQKYHSSDDVEPKEEIKEEQTDNQPIVEEKQKKKDKKSKQKKDKNNSNRLVDSIAKFFSKILDERVE